MAALQATGVAIGARGLLIEGPSGVGKSSLALALIDRGAQLIGDDSLVVEAHAARLIATPHPNTRGLLEVRNLGLLAMPVCDEAAVSLMIRLDPEAPRFVEAPERIEIEGVAIPLLSLSPDGGVLALKAELALERYGLSVV